MCATKHAQSTQNNKSTISLQYLNKDVSDEIDFLHADKHKGLLKIDTMILMEIASHSHDSENSKFSMPLQYLKKEVRDEVDFSYAGKRQSFLQFDFNTSAINVSYKVILSLLIAMINHSQSAQSKKVGLSSQYHKKEVRNGVHFLHAD